MSIKMHTFIDSTKSVWFFRQKKYCTLFLISEEVCISSRHLGAASPGDRPVDAIDAIDRVDRVGLFGFLGFRVFAPDCRRAARPRLSWISRKPGLRRRTPSHETPGRKPAKGGSLRRRPKIRNPGAGAARLAGRLASATGSLGVSELDTKTSMRSMILLTLRPGGCPLKL